MSDNISALYASVSTLSSFESLVFRNSESFAARFCHGEVMDITAVWFSSRFVKIDYVLDCGQHITDTIDLDDFTAWAREVMSSAGADQEPVSPLEEIVRCRTLLGVPDEVLVTDALEEVLAQNKALAAELLTPHVFSRLVDWLQNPRPASAAFTASIERQIAYALEMDVLPTVKSLRIQLDNAQKELATLSKQEKQQE